ncbi:MAG: hypothetical protein WC310_00285 [Patescibacteria group bacterium]|jgi:glycogen debranching enzyme
MSQIEKKLFAATAILRRCIGKEGIWADSTRYQYQCWTRDFVLAVLEVLLQSQRDDLIRKHLHGIAFRQQPNGQIPILFLENEFCWLWEKIKRSIKNRKVSFMLRRYFTGHLWDLTPGTRDSEIMFLVGMYEYAKQSGDNSLVAEHNVGLYRAQTYIEKFLMENGLVVGCDWRDTMERELGDKPLLTNNSLMYRAYNLMGEKEKADRLRANINSVLWDGQRYLDYPDSERFDPLGGALAVLYDVALPERYASIIEGFRSVDTDRGVTIQCRHNPMVAEEAKVINRTNGVVIWPFVLGFTVLALIKMGEKKLAKAQFDKLVALDGFREWYDPATGKGYGAKEQLWSAALYLRALRAIRNM